MLPVVLELCVQKLAQVSAAILSSAIAIARAR